MINNSKYKIIDISFLNKINNKTFIRLKESYFKGSTIIVNFDEKTNQTYSKKQLSIIMSQKIIYGKKFLLILS